MCELFAIPHSTIMSALSSICLPNISIWFVRVEQKVCSVMYLNLIYVYLVTFEMLDWCSN